MSPTSHPVTVEVDSRRFIRWVFVLCVSIALFIGFADIFLNVEKWVPWGPMRRFFNITREDGLANWWSASQTLLVGLVLWAIVIVLRRSPAPSGGRPRFEIGGWALIAAFFTFMSLDDGSKLHERLGSTYKRIVGAGEPGVETAMDWFPSYSWQLVVAPFFIAMGLFIAGFLWRQLGKARLRWMIFAALAILAVAMGMDFLEGTDEGIFDDPDVKHYMKTVEEVLEMLANTVFLCTFLHALADRFPSIDLRFDPPPPSQAPPGPPDP